MHALSRYGCKTHPRAPEDKRKQFCQAHSNSFNSIIDCGGEGKKLVLATPIAARYIWGMPKISGSVFALEIHITNKQK